MTEKRNELPSILFAIAQRDVAPWKEIRNLGQEATWVKRFREYNLQVIYYLSEEPSKFQETLNNLREFNRFRKNLGKLQGKFDEISTRYFGFKEQDFEFIRDEFELRVNGPSTYYRVHERNFALFNWFLEKNSEKYLFRTNVSSYLNYRALQNYLELIGSSDNFIGGAKMDSENGHLISGAGIFMPRKTVEIMISNWHILERNMIEDVALSRLAYRLRIPIINLPRIDFSNPSMITSSDIESIKSNFHFRCKGVMRPEDDIEIMETLDEYIFSK